MQKEFVTTNAKQTQKLGEMLAEEILADGRFNLKNAKSVLEVESRSAFVVCLSGELGAGKTTFTQGFLQGLGLQGPFTSPTFLIMKEYRSALKTKNYKLKTVYHIDAYRINEDDLLNLGWEEMIANKNNIIIIEWAGRLKEIIPADSLWVNFEWMGEKERKITLTNSQ